MQREKITKMIREGMLPVAMLTGVGAYLVYHFTPALRPIGPVCHDIAVHGNAFLISVMLFLQYVRIAPGDLRLRRWHGWALLFQLSAYVIFTAITLALPQGTWRILAECALLCLVCPTASAAGIITERLGGKLSETVTYVVLIYVLTTFLMPAVIPLIHPNASLGFWNYVWLLVKKMFPMLILPGVLAWSIRYLFPGFHAWLHKVSPASFYVWGVSLSMAMALATRALLLSHPGWVLLAGITLVSFLACFLQYHTGHKLGQRYGDSITPGQSLGQKNNGLLIWIGYSFMTPITSIAGGLYAIFQNLYNSWEIYRKENR